MQDRMRLEYDFSKSYHDWSGGFSDLPADYDPDLYQLEFAHTETPAELEPERALMLSGRNASDDLFMFVKKGLTSDDGIAPNTTYRITFEVAFGTDAPAGAVGIGGPPGESVWVKVGAAPFEPVARPEGDMGGEEYLLMNVDKGRQNDDGEHALRIGDVAKAHDEEFGVYELKTLNNADEPLEITSDEAGNLWIFVGTDSGFEGATTLYYTNISVELVPVE
ncbi:MAG: hypothetical protein R6V13_11945 [Anaerolineae bacterium]